MGPRIRRLVTFARHVVQADTCSPAVSGQETRHVRSGGGTTAHPLRGFREGISLISRDSLFGRGRDTMRSRRFEERHFQVKYRTLMLSRMDPEKLVQVQQRSNKKRRCREESAIWNARKKFKKQENRAMFPKAMI